MVSLILLWIFIFSREIWAQNDFFAPVGAIIPTRPIKVTMYPQQARVTRKGSLPINLSSITKEKEFWLHVGPIVGDMFIDSLEVRATGLNILQVLVENFFDFQNIPVAIMNSKEELEKLFQERINLQQQQRMAKGRLNFLQTLDYNSFPNNVDHYPNFNIPAEKINASFEILTKMSSEHWALLQNLQKLLATNQENIDLISHRLAPYLNIADKKWLPHVFILVENQESDKKVASEIELSYLIPSSQWYPIYDLRVSLDHRAARASVLLVTSGMVRQETLENWENIDLQLSVINPTVLFPRSLGRWVLQEKRTAIMEKSRGGGDAGDTLGGGGAMSSSIMPMMASKSRKSMENALKGDQFNEAASMDVSSDNGSYEMVAAAPAEKAELADKAVDQSNFPLKSLEQLFPQFAHLQKQLSHLQSTPALSGTLHPPAPAKSFVATAPDQNFAEAAGYLIEYHAPIKVSLASNRPVEKIPLANQKFVADLQYFAIPKSSKKVFLQAQMANTSALPLLNGSAQIFMDGDLVSKTELHFVAPENFFSVDLGEDPNVETKRTVKKNSETKGMLVETHRTTVEVTIEIVNHHDFPIKITIHDQHPVSTNDKIKITPLNPSPQMTINAEGMISWTNIIVSAKKKVPLAFSYQV